MKESIFGAMSFNHGWTKKEVLNFWGTPTELKIRVSCYPGENPNEAQTDAYESFKTGLAKVSEESLVKLSMFLSRDPESGLSSNLEKTVNEMKGVVHPFEVLFFKDGSCAIECYTDWSEDGVSVLVKYDKMQVGYSDELLDGRI